MEIDEESDQFMFHLFYWRPHFNCMASRVAVHRWRIPLANSLIKGRRPWASGVNPEQTVPDLEKKVYQMDQQTMRLNF